MTVNRVQSTSAVISGNTLSLSLSGVTAGNALICCLAYYHASNTNSVGVPSDSNGTFTLALKSEQTGLFSDPNTILGAIQWYELNAAAGTHSVVITLPSTLDMAGHAALLEYSSVPTSGALDKTSGGGQVAATQSVSTGATPTLSQANDLAIAQMVVNTTTGVANAGISDPPSGYSSILAVQTTNTDIGVEFCDAIISSTTAQNVSWTWTDSSTVAAAALVATYNTSGLPSGGTITPTAGALNTSGTTAGVQQRQNTVIQPIVAHRDRRIWIPSDRKIFLPNRRAA